MKTVLHLHPKTTDGTSLHPLFQDKTQWREQRLVAKRQLKSDWVGHLYAMPKVKSASVDGVFSRDDLIYLLPKQVNTALTECWRALKPGGTLVLFTPDAQWAAYQIALDQVEEPILGEAAPKPTTSPWQMLYQQPEAAQLPWPSARICNLFTARYLARKLIAAGFHNIQVKRGGQNNLLAHALKPIAGDASTKPQASVPVHHPYHLKPAPAEDTLPDDLDAEPAYYHEVQ